MVVFIRVCAKSLKILNSCLSEYFGQLLLSIWQWAIPGKDERPNRGGGGGGGGGWRYGIYRGIEETSSGFSKG